VTRCSGVRVCVAPRERKEVVRRTRRSKVESRRRTAKRLRLFPSLPPVTCLTPEMRFNHYDSIDRALRLTTLCLSSALCMQTRLQQTSKCGPLFAIYHFREAERRMRCSLLEQVVEETRVTTWLITWLIQLEKRQARRVKETRSVSPSSFLP
jgi:hypothetical protein